MQRAPLHRDLAVADAEEAAEVDHRGLRLTLVAYKDIYETADILALEVLYGVPKDGERLVQRNLLHLLHLAGGGRRGGQQQC
jgi:hypothetical protein